MSNDNTTRSTASVPDGTLTVTSSGMTSGPTFPVDLPENVTMYFQPDDTQPRMITLHHGFTSLIFVRGELTTGVPAAFAKEIVNNKKGPRIATDDEVKAIGAAAAAKSGAGEEQPETATDQQAAGETSKNDDASKPAASENAGETSPTATDEPKPEETASPAESRQRKGTRVTGA
jgi:hypothetical protein